MGTGSGGPEVRRSNGLWDQMSRSHCTARNFTVDILSVQLHNLGHTRDNSVRLLVGSRHHFDLVKIGLGHNNGISTSGESTRILTLASGSSTGAISATEVRLFIYPKVR